MLPLGLNAAAYMEREWPPQHCQQAWKLGQVVEQPASWCVMLPVALVMA